MIKLEREKELGKCNSCLCKDFLYQLKATREVYERNSASPVLKFCTLCMSSIVGLWLKEQQKLIDGSWFVNEHKDI